MLISIDKYLLIKEILIRNNLTQSILAKNIGISKQYLSQVIRGLSQSPRIRQAIEKELKTKIWNTDTDNNDKSTTPRKRRTKQNLDMYDKNQMELAIM